MQTYIYMVRHGESPKLEEDERTRGLTEKGWLDAHRITELLKDEGITVFTSSPYNRAILTIQELAHSLGKEIVVFEDLKETVFAEESTCMADKELYPVVRKMFADPEFSLPGGETRMDCQKRAVAVLKEILKTYAGQKVAIGTHGMIMTLMMEYFDRQYDVDFLFQTSKPDVYRMEFIGEELVEVQRLWKIDVETCSH